MGTGISEYRLLKHFMTGCRTNVGIGIEVQLSETDRSTCNLIRIKIKNLIYFRRS